MACTSGWSCHSVHSPATLYTAAMTTSSTGRVRPLTCMVCSGSGQVNVAPPTVVCAARLEGAAWLGVVDLVYPLGVAAAWLGGCSAGLVATVGIDADAPNVLGPPQDRQNRSPSSICAPQLPQNAMACPLVADGGTVAVGTDPWPTSWWVRACPVHSHSHEHLPREDHPRPVCGPMQGPSGTFLASELLSGKRAAQGWFSGWPGVLPKSTPGGVFVEFEELVQSCLGGVGVGEDALGSGSAFVAGGVEQDGFLDAGEVGQELADAEVQSGLVGLSAHEVGDGQGQDAVEDGDADFGLGPVEHRGEPDDVGVFELAEPLLDVVLGAVPGYDLGHGPVVVVRDYSASASAHNCTGMVAGSLHWPRWVRPFQAG